MNARKFRKEYIISTYVDEMETLEGLPDDDPLRNLVMKDPNKLKVFASVLLQSVHFVDGGKSTGSRPPS